MSESEREDTPVIKPEPSRRRRQIDSDDDQDQPEQDQDASAKRVKLEKMNGHSTGHSNGKKRAHTSDAEEEEEDDQEEDGEGQGEEVIEASEQARTGEKKQLVRDHTGYVTGSIVRIACQSFLTYDQVEFKPGPALNMIIGPNGTGKSTIACAIAIGLGFPAKVLGRSTKLSSYPKNDSNEECWIEIELKGKPNEENVVIRRNLRRDSEKSTFSLDGNPATAKEIGEVMENLSVQVGNLCTFLPQDRVASFAMMNHSELLQETEKAAGHVNLSYWHQTLIDEYKAQKEKRINVETYTKKLDKISSKQSEASKEVEQFEQRKKHEQSLQIVKVLLKYAKYNKVFLKLNDLKTERNVLENLVKELEAKNKPFRDSKDLLQQISKASVQAYDELDKKIRQSQKSAQKKSEQVSRNVEESEQLTQDLKGLRKDEQTRLKIIGELEKKIEKLKPLVEKGEPEENDTRELDAKLSNKAEEIREKDDSVHRVGLEIQSLERNLTRMNEDRKNKISRIQHMNQAHVQRENNTAQYDKDCWEAVKWLRSNKDKFKGEIFEPPRLTIFPKDEFKGTKFRFGAQGGESGNEILRMIEGPISKDAFRTFLFELREDYDLFMRELADKGGLKLNATEITLSQEIRRGLSETELNDVGFDVLACDMLKGPAPVIAWLANEHNLGRTPLQLHRRPIDDKRVSRMRQINRYYTREGSVSVKISNYGNRNAMTESRSLPSAKILSGCVDEEKVKQFQVEVETIVEELKKGVEKRDKLKTMQVELEEQKNILAQERGQLKLEKEAINSKRAKWHKAKVTLQNDEKVLARTLQLQQDNSSDRKRVSIARDLKKVMSKRIKLAHEYKEHILQVEKLQNFAIKLHLQAIQADSDHRTMEALVRDRDEELENRKKEFEAIKVQFRDLRDEGKALQQEATNALDGADEEIIQEVQRRRQEDTPDLEQLEGERDEINAKLDCMISVSDAVVEAYKKRKGEISDLEGKLEEATESLNQSIEEIEETKAKWYPELKTLVDDISQRFTASFDTLGLMGEVRLAEDEDYEKWGIEIMVSFRDKDAGDVNLHVLTGQRQSGGERALTTVTYLLALAELARAPFALVDEINQGMDQRAERNMHKMLVETTCKDDVGQYFLLTPKLLPDLVYHEKMKVLVINSGSFIPEDLSLKAMVERRKQLNKESRRLGRISVPPV